MTEPTRKQRSPIRVAIAVLSVALAVMAVVVAYLVWGRTAPTVVPAPTPSASATSPAPSVTVSTAPIPTPSAPTTTAPGTTPASSSAPATTEVPASPSPPPSPTPTSTTSAAPSASPAQTMMWEGKATFEHFSVEVLQDDATQGDPMLEDKAGLLVEVCATSALDGSDTVRITSDPWTLEDSTGNVQTPQDGGHTPSFPADGEYAVGECARGYLTFDYLPVDNDYANLVYENGLGDRAVWQFH